MTGKGQAASISRPRKEAGTLDFPKLTPVQRNAAQGVLALLSGIAKAQSLVDQAPTDLIRIEPVRHNCTILLDGDRGSGKTSLLVSTLDALQRNLGQSVDTQYPHSVTDEWKKVLAEHLNGVVVVPIALIDLAPLPSSSNLLLLMVSCLERLVLRMEGHFTAGAGNHNGRVPWMGDMQKPIPSRQYWTELANAIVECWEGDDRRRQVPSDLEAYAREQMTAEQQRQELSLHIDRFLSALHSDFRKYLVESRSMFRRSEPPPVLFLLAVDDADMNPGRVGELLDALRVLGHRQLAFLLTGNSRLFQQSLRRSCLVALGGKRVRTSDTTSRAVRMSELLASQIYDKLIPPQHRYPLSRLAPQERLHVLVSTTFTGLDLGDVASLTSLLEKVTPAVLAFFDTLPWLMESLPGQLRGLQNLALLCQRLDDSEQVLARSQTSASGSSQPDTVPLFTIVEELWRWAIEDAGLLDPERAVGSVARNANQEGLRVTLQANVASKPLRVLPSVSLLPQTRKQPTATVSVIPFLTNILMDDASLLAEERAAWAALLLAALTACKYGGQVSALAATSTNGLEPLLVLVHLRIEVREASGMSSTEQFDVGWPIPHGLSLHEQILLAHEWKRKTSHLSAAASLGSDFVTRFIDVLLQFARSCSAHPMLDAPPDEREAALDPKLARVVSLSRTFASSSAHLTSSIRSWAQGGVGLLAAPESGLELKVANHVLLTMRRKFGATAWPEVRRALRHSRRMRFQGGTAQWGRVAKLDDQPVGDHDQTEVLSSTIDRAFPEYDWRLEVEEGTEAAATRIFSKANITAALSTVKLFECASAHWLRQLEGCVAADKTPGELASRLRDAWQATGRQESYGVVLDLQAASQAAKQEPLDVLREIRPQLQVQRLPVGAVLGSVGREAGLLPATVREAAIPAFSKTTSELSPLQVGILHLLFDDSQDGASDVPLVANWQWPAVSVGVGPADLGLEIPWPGMRFRSFAAAGYVISHWNQAMQPLRESRRRIRREQLDALAYYYLRLCLKSSTQEEVSFVLSEQAPEASAWKELLDSLAREVSRSAGGPRQKVLVGAPLGEVLLLIPLLAAPESGLSYAAVRAILSYLNEHDPQHSQIKASLALRQERLQNLDGAAADLLQHLEESARLDEHPFQIWLDGLNLSGKAVRS